MSLNRPGSRGPANLRAAQVAAANRAALPVGPQPGCFAQGSSTPSVAVNHVRTPAEIQDGSSAHLPENTPLQVAPARPSSRPCSRGVWHEAATAAAARFSRPASADRPLTPLELLVRRPDSPLELLTPLPGLGLTRETTWDGFSVVHGYVKSRLTADNEIPKSLRTTAFSSKATIEFELEPKPRRTGWSSVFDIADRICDAYRIADKRHQMQETHGPGLRVKTLVLSKNYNIGVNVVIILNCVFIGWQADQRQPSLAKDFLENLFTFTFAAELFLRLFTCGWTWVFRNGMNCLDVFLVFLSILIVWVLQPANIEAGFLRQLTVLRTMRLIKLAHAVRLVPEFKEMWQLVQGLAKSMPALFWSSIMTSVVLYGWSIAAVVLIGQSEQFEGDKLANERFMNLWKSMFTHFQLITLDNWGDLLRNLLANNPGSGWVAVYFCIYMFTTVYVFMNLVTAVIVRFAFAAAKESDREQLKALNKQKEQDMCDLREMMHHVDKDCDGTLSVQEFYKSTRIDTVKQKLMKFNITKSDVKSLWDLMGTSDNCIDTSDFIEGIRMLKGLATKKEIMRAMCEIRVMERSVSGLERTSADLSHRLGRATTNLRGMQHEFSAFERTLQRANNTLRYVAKRQNLAVDSDAKWTPGMRR